MALNDGMRRVVRFRDSVLAAVFVALLSTACKRQEPRSTIVDAVKEAGAGDVESASAFSIDDWMRKHRDVAARVEGMCGPVRERADAQWADSTEGKVCTAARNTAMSTYSSPRDGKGYHAGDK
jgi:hypothetical protein